MGGHQSANAGLNASPDGLRAKRTNKNKCDARRTALRTHARKLRPATEQKPTSLQNRLRHFALWPPAILEGSYRPFPLCLSGNPFHVISNNLSPSSFEQKYIPDKNCFNSQQYGIRYA